MVALATAVYQALFAFAPGAFGALRDLTGGYGMPVAAAAVLDIAAAILILSVSTRRGRDRALSRVTTRDYRPGR